MNAITKAELAEKLSTHVGIKKREAKKLVDQFFEIIRHILELGESVKLSGFGRLTLRDKHARPGRNPKTGKEVVIDKRRVVIFKAGQKLKSRVIQSKKEESQ